MAALAVSPIVLAAAGAFALPPIFGELNLLFQNWDNIRNYLLGSTPSGLSSSPSTEVTIREEINEYETPIVDGVLVASGATGLWLLTIPGLRWYGAASLAASFLFAQSRPNAKLIAATSTGLVLFATNPVAASAAAFSFLGTTANATLNSASAALQLSTTVVGVIVTTSGAIVGYVLADSSNSNKRKRTQ